LTRTNDERESISIVNRDCLVFTDITHFNKNLVPPVQLSKYIETGVDEFDQEKPPDLLNNKYQSMEDAKVFLGDAVHIKMLFIDFQEHFYLKKVT